MRTGKYLFVFLLLSSQTLVGQTVLEKGKQHLEKLASDEMYGRGYVHNGYQKAAEYVASMYAAYGLQKFGDKYFQDFVYPVNTFPDSVTVVVGDKKLVPGQDFIVTPESGSAKGDFKIVYYDLAKLYWKNLPQFTKDQVVVIKPYKKKMSKDSLTFVRRRISDFNDQTHVVLLNDGKLTWSVADEALSNARIEIMANVFDTTAKTIRLNVHNKLDPSFLSCNVVGYVKSKKKKCKKYLVVTAHLDHLGMMGSQAVFNGANDNASGVSMLLTLAEHYAKTRPKYNIVFIAFGGEEAGLIGSKFFVDNPIIDLKNIKFLMNIDLMGNGSDGITVVNATKFPKPFELLNKVNNKTKAVSVIKPRGEAANSDHYWFTQAGVPSFFIYTMGGSTAYHDIYDKAQQLPMTKFSELNQLIIDFMNAVK